MSACFSQDPLLQPPQPIFDVPVDPLTGTLDAVLHDTHTP